jgi:pyruvate dehydrogenase E2 component (dihydrolipoamide acetyltransferase)
MAEEVFIPKFGQTVEDVTLVRWLVEDGQEVDQGQPVLDVETDKAIFSVEATDKGFIHIGPYREGDIVPVVTVVAFIGKADEKFEFPRETSNVEVPAAVKGKQAAGKPDPLEQSPLAPDLDGRKLFASPRARKYARAHGVDLTMVPASGGGGKRIVERDVLAFLSKRPKATPVAQKIAQEAGINLSQITGSGPQGRITRADVELVARRTAEGDRDDQAVQPAIDSSITFQQQAENGVLERIPLKGVRGIIASRMAESVQTTARVTLLMEVDATAFVSLRERLKERYADEWGFSPGYNDLLVKIAAAALRQYPYMNARMAVDVIEVLASINIGMAVDTNRGLIVPVLRDVDRKNLQQIGGELRRLVRKAQEASVLPDEISGGTFTITNLGMYDVIAFTPVINLPEVAILGVGKISSALKMRDGQVAEYKKLVLSLVFDHRLVDGAPAARFLQYIKDMIEDPALIITV